MKRLIYWSGQRVIELRVGGGAVKLIKSQQTAFRASLGFHSICNSCTPSVIGRWFLWEANQFRKQQSVADEHSLCRSHLCNISIIRIS